jgi:hypothetical protein
MKERIRNPIWILSKMYRIEMFSHRPDKLCVTRFFDLAPNGYVYETFGISKHFPVKLQALLIRAEMLDNALTAKCFIYDVSISLFLFKCYFISQWFN